MAIVHANDENFQQLTNSGAVLVDFYADWCGPCKRLTPILENVANDRSDVKIVKVNVDEAPSIAQEFGVMSIPTLVVLKDGNVATKNVGLCSKEDIIEMLNI